MTMMALRQTRITRKRPELLRRTSLVWGAAGALCVLLGGMDRSQAERINADTYSRRVEQARVEAVRKKEMAWRASSVGFHFRHGDSLETVEFIRPSADGPAVTYEVDIAGSDPLSPSVERFLEQCRGGLVPEFGALIKNEAFERGVPPDVAFIAVGAEMQYVKGAGFYLERADNLMADFGGFVGPIWPALSRLALPHRDGWRSAWTTTLGYGQRSPDLLLEMLRRGYLREEFEGFVRERSPDRLSAVISSIEDHGVSRPGAALPFLVRYLREPASSIRAAVAYLQMVVEDEGLDASGPLSALSKMKLLYAHLRYRPGDRFKAFRDPAEVLRLILFDQDPGYPKHAFPWELGFPVLLLPALSHVVSQIYELLEIDHFDVPEREFFLKSPQTPYRGFR